jgi:3-methyladenine DNA glycosylase AlkD
MTIDDVMLELKSYGNETTKRIFQNHGAREPLYGVKVQDLKKIVKKIKKDYPLSLELYQTGNSDAMYLAGLIADENLITKENLQEWVKGAYWYMISDYTVPWIAAESKYGYELAIDWIESEEEFITSAGWSTLSSLVSIKPDAELDIKYLSQLLERVEKEIHEAQNRVRYSMNGFVIAVGSYIQELTEKALEVGSHIGKVNVDMGGTACKVPLSKEYIQKVIDKGHIGKKRKVARC